MAHSSYDIHMEPGDSLLVMNRLTGLGCSIAFAKDARVYLSPEQENQLLQLLLQRAPRQDLGLAMGLPLGFDVGFVSGSVDSKTGKVTAYSGPVIVGAKPRLRVDNTGGQP